MDENINLLGGKQPPKDQERFIPIVRNISIGLLGLVVCLTVLFFILKSQSSLPTLEAQQKQLISTLNTQNLKVGKFLFIKDRINVSKQISTSRFAVDVPLGTLKKSLMPGILLDRLTLDKQSFSLTIGSNSIGIMHNYLENFQLTTAKDPIFKRITLEGVTYDEKNNRYTVLIQGELK